jgi:hypothetical protein
MSMIKQNKLMITDFTPDSWTEFKIVWLRLDDNFGPINNPET